MKKRKGRKIYIDLRFSRAVKESIVKAGGIPIELRVGNPFYKEKLLEDGGIMAGESSGHIMFAENFDIDDGLFSALKLLEIISREKKSLSALLQPFKKYYQSDEINFPSNNSREVIMKVGKRYPGAKKIYLDGLTVEYKDWWFNLRPSQTEPLLRLIVEAKTSQQMKKRLEEVSQIIKVKLKN